MRRSCTILSWISLNKCRYIDRANSRTRLYRLRNFSRYNRRSTDICNSWYRLCNEHRSRMGRTGNRRYFSRNAPPRTRYCYSRRYNCLYRRCIGRGLNTAGVRNRRCLSRSLTPGNRVNKCTCNWLFHRRKSHRLNRDHFRTRLRPRRTFSRNNQAGTGIRTYWYRRYTWHYSCTGRTSIHLCRCRSDPRKILACRNNCSCRLYLRKYRCCTRNCPPRCIRSHLRRKIFLKKKKKKNTNTIDINVHIYKKGVPKFTQDLNFAR